MWWKERKEPFREVSSGPERNSADIACGEGALRVLTVQLEGKKKMSVKDFLLGYDVREENFDVTG